MTLFLGVALAAAMLAPQTTDPTPLPQTPANAVADVVVQGVGPEGPRPDQARRDDPNEVVCENRAVTGSRFTQRRCRTRAQAGIAAAEARNFLAESTRGGPTTDAALSGPNSGPQ